MLPMYVKRYISCLTRVETLILLLKVLVYANSALMEACIVSSSRSSTIVIILGRFYYRIYYIYIDR